MSWYDYVFEDPVESYERCQDEMEEVKRKCKKCNHKFWSAYSSACPGCDGWTEIEK